VILRSRTKWMALHVVALIVLGGLQLDAQVADSTVHVRIAYLNPAADRADVTLERTGDNVTTQYSARGNGSGEATFSHVPPGAYRLIVNGPGLAAVKEQKIKVSAGEVLLITLTPANYQAQPNGPDMVIRRHHFSNGTLFDENRLRDLPASDSIWPLIETADPFTFSDRMDTGGLSAGDSALVAGYSSSWTQTTYHLDGMDVTDLTRGGTPFIYPSLDAFSAVSVTSTAMPLEAGSAGPAVTLVPRRPSNNWIADIAGDWTPGSIVRSTSPGHIPYSANLTSWSRGHFLASGPLVANRVGLLMSGTMIRSGRQERNGPTILPGDVNSLFAHLVVTPPRPYEFRFLVAGQRVIRPYVGRARFEDGHAEERDRQLQLQGTWERRPGSEAHWRIAAGYQRSGVTPQFSGLVSAPAIERVYDGFIPELVATTSGNRARWTTSAVFEPQLTKLQLRHDLRMGLSLSGASASSRPDPPGLMPEIVGGVPARVWDYHYAGPVSRWQETIVAGYVADRITPSDQVAIEGGLRVETLHGRAKPAPSGIAWTNFSPRISVRWKPRSNELVTLVGSYARYQWQLPLQNLAFGDPTAAQGRVYRWLDANHDRLFQPSEIGPLIARVGPGSPSGQTAIDPNLRSSHTKEFVIGIESRPSDSLFLRLAGTFRTDSDLIASVNVGVPLSGYTVGHVPDVGGDELDPSDDQMLPFYNRNPVTFGEDRELLTNPIGLRNIFHGLDLIVERSLAKRFQMLLGATMTGSDAPGANRGFHVFENDHGLVGELLTNPNATTFAQNRNFFERGYSIKVSGSYHAPRDVRIGVAARYQDGQPFARMVIVPELNQGAEAIRAYREGRTRFMYALTVDARIEKRVTVRAFDVGVVIEAFNLLNTKNEVEEDVLTGPNFRATTAVQPPRVVRIGLRLGM
jgi:TonB-dependent receptor-like protein/polysaccharide lyase family 4-like protein